MKKTLIIAMVTLALPLAGHAQLGNLLEKTARKTVNKTTEKLVDKASERASEAVSKTLNKEVEKRFPSDQNADEQATETKRTYESLMMQLPELPSADQLVKYKEAELSEKTFRLITSKVTIFTAKVVDLSTQCATLGYEDLDSTQATNMAMQMTSAYTGLSQEEIEKLSKMSDEEQEAWLKTHYSQERAQTAMMNQAVDASKWLEPLKPTIDKWAAAGEKADAAYHELDNRLRPIFAKYADKLAATTDSKERNNLLLAYYTEAVPHIRTAVQNAINIRLKEQLPIAEEIESDMAKIRAAHPDAVNQLLNYPKLTATQYFTETSRLLDIPQYDK